MSYTQTRYDAGVLEEGRCPHCNVATPLLSGVHAFHSGNANGTSKYKWRVYVCSRCGFPTVGGCTAGAPFIELVFPKRARVADEIPEKPRSFLTQATESIHAPSGAIMLCASSVDAMLKEKGLKTGNLYSRIEAAAKSHLVTQEMAVWAHEIRLDANDERHADDTAPLPTEEDARKAIAFTSALAEFLFVLPTKIERGRRAHSQQTA